MSRIAILSKKALASRPYDKWLSATGTEIILLASDHDHCARAVATDGGQRFAEVYLFPDWECNDEVRMAVVAAHRRGSLDGIIALSESDLIRAARLREELGIQGQGLESVLAFRDKVVMKTTAASNGLAVPSFATVRGLRDVFDFAVQTGYPIVVKPALSAGSVGVNVLRNREDAQAMAAVQTDGTPFPLMVEEFIDAPLLSVDGIMANRRVQVASVSTYTLDCYSSVSTSSPHGLLQVPESDPRALRARDYLDRLLKVLPSPETATSFHCELFDSVERGVLLCEIASRTGGGRVNDMVRHSHGVDLDQWTTLGQAGLDPCRLLPAPVRSRWLMGDILFPSAGRTLLRSPATCPLPNVVDFNVLRAVGTFVPRSKKVSDYVIDLLLQAANRMELETVYLRSKTWVESEVLWDLPKLSDQAVDAERRLQREAVGGLPWT